MTDRFINVMLTITLIEMMIAIGMGVKLADLTSVARSPSLLVRAVIANYLCVPLITVGLLVYFGSPSIIAAGFLVIAVCPGAAYGPPFTAIAGGNVAAAVGLMVILAGSCAICAPLLLQLLLPLMAKGQTLRVDVLKMVVTLLVSQLLPLFSGLCMREWHAELADKLKRPADYVSVALNLGVFAAIIVLHFNILVGIPARALIGMFALVVSSLAAGWLLGGRASDNRKAMGFSTSVRNVAVGLVIATANFPGTPAVTAALAYNLFQTIMLAVVAAVWGRIDATRRIAAGRTVQAQ